MTDLVDRIGELFGRHGDIAYDGARSEPVTARAHALQCAQLAEWARAPTALIAAALLHDIGHLLVADGAPVPDDVDDAHELQALPFLSQAFAADVTEPVRLHVAAKRYLVATDPRYLAQLSPASVHSLALQGGPMTCDEQSRFEQLPHWEDGVRLRRWDDLAKTPRRSTPPIGYYLAALRQIAAPQPTR